MAAITLSPGGTDVAEHAVALFGPERVPESSGSEPIHVDYLSDMEVSVAEEYFSDTPVSVQKVNGREFDPTARRSY